MNVLARSHVSHEPARGWVKALSFTTSEPADEEVTVVPCEHTITNKKNSKIKFNFNSNNFNLVSLRFTDSLISTITS